MKSLAQQVSDKYKKSAVVDVRPGDTVRVHQKIVEGGKERVQVFEGLVIKASRDRSLTSTFSVRRIASGIGVEKTYLIHSPNVLKVEVMRRSKVRRNYLTYMRNLTGKSARLSNVDFDKESVNTVHDEQAEAEEERIVQEHAEQHDEIAKETKAEEAEAKEAAEAAQPKAESEKIESQPTEKPDAKAATEDKN